MELKIGDIVAVNNYKPGGLSLATVLHTNGWLHIVITGSKEVVVADDIPLIRVMSDGKVMNAVSDKKVITLEKEVIKELASFLYRPDDYVVFLSDILDEDVCKVMVYKYKEIPLSNPNKAELDIIPFNTYAIQEILDSFAPGSRKILSDLNGIQMADIKSSDKKEGKTDELIDDSNKGTECLEINVGDTVVLADDAKMLKHGQDPDICLVVYTDGNKSILVGTDKRKLMTVEKNSDLWKIVTNEYNKPIKKYDSVKFENYNRVVRLSDILNKDIINVTVYRCEQLIALGKNPGLPDFIPYRNGNVSYIIRHLDLKGYRKIVSYLDGDKMEDFAYSSKDEDEDEDDRITRKEIENFVLKMDNDIRKKYREALKASNKEIPEESVKNDFKDDKLRWDLLPLEDLEEVVALYTFGCKKYGENRWQNLSMGEDRYRGALMRHLLLHLKGEEFDPESNIRHLAAVIWNAIAMYHCYINNKRDLRKNDKEEFIKKAISVHGLKYMYDKVEYINNHTKVAIECPRHGFFWQSPNDHISGGYGCPRCASANMKKPVYGVGINDMDYSIGTPLYRVWTDMLKRCYDDKFIKKHPSYKGCSVCDEWKRLSIFNEWFIENYIPGYELDKDIVSNGGKIYSPANCAFVPREINRLMVHTGKNKNNGLPLGVYLKRGVKYGTHIGKRNNKRHLGYYDTADEAFEIYKNEKENYIKEVAEEYYKKNMISKRVYDALINYRVPKYG